MDELVWYYPVGHESHQERGHPERPERIEAIRNAFEQVGWWGVFPKLSPIVILPSVLQRVHSQEYLNVLELSCRRGGHLDADTFVTPYSWDLAHQTAGGALAVAKAVWSRKAQKGFALTRPPGHHACHGHGMGFCLLNNIALAADTLIHEYGAKRLAIVDLDLHHGNGTQDIFWRRKDVFYLSTHQSPLFPGTGYLTEIGAGDGSGYNANFPFSPGSGDRAMLTVMDSLILPLLAQYQPEMILISYGFDLHWSDPLGHLCLSAQGVYETITRLVTWADANCQGKIAVILEGGYNLEAAAACSLGVTAALLHQSFSDPLGPAPYLESKAWQSMVEQAKSQWDL